MKVLSFNFKWLIPVVALPVALLYLATDREAAVPSAPLGQDRLDEIQQLLIDKDPKLLLERNAHAFHLTEAEVNALLDYFLQSVRPLQGIAGELTLVSGGATLAASVPLRNIPFRQHLNLELSVIERNSELSVERLTLGSLRIPGPVVEPLLALSRPLLERERNFRLLSSILNTVEGTSLTDDGLALRLNWREENLADISRQARKIFIDEEERRRLLDYYTDIDDVVRTLPQEQTRVRLSDLLRPLFRAAVTRSAAGADPIAQNRALFIAMSAYVNEIPLEQLAGSLSGEATPRPRHLSVRVGPREDLAQHILTSAAIAASAGAAMADILSIYKEVHDARHSTGFSFSDLTANQVGSALGKISTRSPADARELQRFLAVSHDESDYMPPVARYDGISEQEFINRYQDHNSARYRARVRQIDEAIAARPLFEALAPAQ